MRRNWGLLIAVLLVVLIQTVARADNHPVLPAQAYLLMDATTGQVLHEHKGRTPLPMASTTKIMTAILALERGKLSDVVTAGQKPYDTSGTTIYLEMGEQQTLENLLYALMLESANDAGVAIAEHLAGTEEAFAGLMNAKAREIGATQTRFVNAHGLHDAEHYTTAYDLALIARYAMRNQAFRKLILTEEKEIPGYKDNPPRKLYSHNRLLGYYAGANGVKNGFTEEAGLTNVASARRGDTELIAVVLGAQDRLWTSSMALLDYGFEHYRTHFLARQGDVVGAAAIRGSGNVPAVTRGDLAVTLATGAEAAVSHTVWEEGLRAPLEAGYRLGRLQAVVAGKVQAEVDLISVKPVGLASAVSGQAVMDQAASGKSLVMLVMGTMIVLFLFNRRRRKPYGSNSRKPFGRDRLYEIRNRRVR